MEVACYCTRWCLCESAHYLSVALLKIGASLLAFKSVEQEGRDHKHCLFNGGTDQVCISILTY